MLTYFDFVRDFNNLSILARLFLTMVCGGLIGIEREYKRRAAGLRTHILISLGAAMTILTSQYLYLVMEFYTDIARLGAQVVSGVGFIGAGVIVVTRERRIKGLATAAGLWTAAVIGLACGAGYVECAFMATFVVLMAELLLIKLERKILSSSRRVFVYLKYDEAENIKNACKYLEEKKVSPSELKISRKKDDEGFDAVFSLRCTKNTSPKIVIEELGRLEGIQKAELM